MESTIPEISSGNLTTYHERKAVLGSESWPDCEIYAAEICQIRYG
jgi:hypothetical protein